MRHKGAFRSHSLVDPSLCPNTYHIHASRCPFTLTACNFETHLLLPVHNTIASQQFLIVQNVCVYTDLAPSVKASPELVFAKCQVLPGSTSKTLKLKQIDPAGHEDHIFEAPVARCHNANDETTSDPMSLRDIGLLQHQNTAAVLDFLRARFMGNNIYVRADKSTLRTSSFW